MPVWFELFIIVSIGRDQNGSEDIIVVVVGAVVVVEVVALADVVMFASKIVHKKMFIFV